MVNSSSLNQLRILSNEEYEGNLKLQNEYKKNLNNLRNLADLGDVTQSMSIPLVFEHDLFKANILGLQLALRVKIEWNPSSNIIIYKLSYQRGKTNYDLDEKVVKIENYSKVIKSYNIIIKTTIIYLKEKILKQIQGNYYLLKKLIENHLNPFSLKLESVLEPLSKLYEEYFKPSLYKFKENIFNFASNNYTDLYNDLKIIPTLEEIQYSLYEESETNLNNFLSQTVNTLDSIIIEHKTNLKNLENNVEKFINISLESLNELKDNQKVCIDFYYRVKEIFQKIDVIIDSFNDNLADALDSEFLLLQSYVNDNLYMNQIDYKINDVEIVWDIFKNNEILIETVAPAGRAEEIVSKLELVRKKYENVKNAFLNKIKNKYEELKNNNIKNGNEEIQKMKKNLIEKRKCFD